MLVFHHNDLDGRAAAYFVGKFYAKGEFIPKDIEFIEMTYETPFPHDKVKVGEYVYILDFSISVADMELLLQKTKNVIWIDHHITAIEKHQDQPYYVTLPGIRSVLFCGAALTYLFFYRFSCALFSSVAPSSVAPSPDSCFTVSECDVDELPRWLILLDDWDCWKLKHEPDVRYFRFGMEAYTQHPTHAVYNALDAGNPIVRHETLGRVLNEGCTIIAYNEQRYKQIRDLLSYKTTLDGYSVWAVNTPDKSSAVFGDISKYPDIDIFSVYTHTRDGYSISLYSSKVHVGELALKYGGGGHKGASGFFCKELPFK